MELCRNPILVNIFSMDLGWIISFKIMKKKIVKFLHGFDTF